MNHIAIVKLINYCENIVCVKRFYWSNIVSINFTARQHSLLASHDRFCLSLCLSHAGKTTQARIMGSSPEDSPMTLVSRRLTPPQNCKGARAPIERGVAKNRQF